MITTLFCYGCNLGPTQTARSIKGFSRRQVAWLNLKYVTEDVLEKGACTDFCVRGILNRLGLDPRHHS